MDGLTSEKLDYKREFKGILVAYSEIICCRLLTPAFAYVLCTLHPLGGSIEASQLFSMKLELKFLII